MIKNYLGILILLSGFICRGQESKLEEKIGASAYETVKNTQGFYDNEQLLTLITRVGKNLEAHLPSKDFDFTYYLVDVPEPNAFATAGGYVFVTRGLLALLQTEDELACVMGHEFIHVIEHHTRNSLYRHVLPAILEVPGNLIGTLFWDELGTVINFPIEMTSNTVTSVFDRKQETEADLKGIELARNAGYNPADFVSILSRLNLEVEYLTGKKSERHLFDDHPLTSDRIERINKKLEGMPMQLKASPPLVPLLEGLVIGQNAKAGIHNADNEFYHPDLDIYFKFPDSWRIQNTPMSITAVDTLRQSAIVIGIDPDHKTLRDALSDFRNRVMKDKDAEILDLQMQPINGFQAAEGITLQHGNTINMSVWVQLSSVPDLLQILGTAKSKSMAEQVMASIASLRPLTFEDRKEINESVIKIDEGLENETFNDFLKRIDNTDYDVILQIFNGLESSQDTVSGKQLKYIESINFFDK